jgi:DNA-binding XRE family transcriptional regulator
MSDHKAYFMNQAFAEAFKATLVYGDSLEKIGKQIGVSRATLWRASKGDSVDLLTAIRMAEYAHLDLHDYIAFNKNAKS